MSAKKSPKEEKGSVLSRFLLLHRQIDAAPDPAWIAATEWIGTHFCAVSGFADVFGIVGKIFGLKSQTFGSFAMPDFDTFVLVHDNTFF